MPRLSSGLCNRVMGVRATSGKSVPFKSDVTDGKGLSWLGDKTLEDKSTREIVKGNPPGLVTQPILWCSTAYGYW